jgi:pimeloyl-ACP methyl ester carboxylesterase
MMKIVITESGHLATQSFGSSDHPALILIMGATASMLGWPDELCLALAEQGLHVIRFDHRDTGKSTTVAAGQANYAVEDMADDVLAVLDAYGMKEATLVGMSLGGYIAQMIALEHTERVRSLVLVSSEPLGWDGAALPGISQDLLNHFGGLSSLDWSDKDAVIEFLLQCEKLCASSYESLEEEAGIRARIQQILERTDSPASMFNHTSLTVRKEWSGRYRAISVPVLVIHGEADPVLPPENGRAIAAAIKDAELLILSGIGHELPRSQLQAIAEVVTRHSLRCHK